ncbi:MAG: DoxX family protein [Gammaproteobacteria bacterium]|nr:DoxX family protein [Gammaproteobacteria bacterium]
MALNQMTGWLVAGPARLLRWLADPLALALRVWIALEFLRSGWLKLTSWENTLFLFREEYHVPVLPPTLAAVAGTAGEIVFPVLLIVGLAGRLSALATSAVNAMAVIAYAHVLLSEGFEAALGQHVLWGLALLVLAVYGPGRLSVDWLLYRRGQAAAHVQTVGMGWSSV